MSMLTCNNVVLCAIILKETKRKRSSNEILAVEIYKWFYNIFKKLNDDTKRELCF